MQIVEDYDLSKLNTFGVPARTRFFAVVTSEAELKELLKTKEFRENKKLFLGGGSNVLFTEDWAGIVILNKLVGMEIVNEDSEQVIVRSMGGEIWDDLVNFTVNRGLWGLENLALVPGTVGAAPMQNIGAYGSELKETLESVEAYDLSTGDKKIFTNEECKLGYRDSVFKNELKGKYFISAVTFRLSKIEKKNISYRVLQEYLEKNKIEIKTSKDVSQAVSNIRRSKLPDPKVLGNAGSFFKNVFLPKDQAQELKDRYADMPSFEEDGLVKIPAAWLIESCGWKGKRVGNVGVHDKQALVLVNHGGATGIEIKKIADAIISSVYEKFGLKLAPEVNFI